MNKKEILEFLELPDGANDREILTRLEDKLIYFKRLAESAPNDFLKKLHTGNIQKVNELRKSLGATTASSSHTAPPVRQPASSPISSQPVFFENQVKAPEFLAWLVRHTENQSTKPFGLQMGLNYVGRTVQSGPTIIIENDPYVSRFHAIFEVSPGSPARFFVADASLMGKPSKNGVYINGQAQRISEKQQLFEGDTIQIGNTKLILRMNRENINNIVRQVEESEYMKTVVIDIF
jgi:hypothetical protein